MNVSEGRDLAALRAIADGCGAVARRRAHRRRSQSLGVHARRAGRGTTRRPRRASLAAAVAARISIADHDGVHPFLGALDVVPFVALGGTKVETRAGGGRRPRSSAQWWAETHGVPVFFYDDADPAVATFRTSAATRSGRASPTSGPDAPHPTLGATAVGARKPLVAINVLLVTRDVAVARRIAREIRESDGGLPGVRALGLDARVARPAAGVDEPGRPRSHRASRTRASTVRELARREHTDVASVEVVGSGAPRRARPVLRRVPAWADIDAGAAIEARIGHAPRWLPE